MNSTQNSQYNSIAKAIAFIGDNFKAQPGLDKIADEVNMSPFHFQRLFTEWAGVSPKKFLQFISIDHARKLLSEEGVTLFDTAFETGLSGTGRLHDMFVQIEGMTPGEYKNGGINLSINYSFAGSPFGNILVASTARGICHLSFADNETLAGEQLHKTFPNATYAQKTDQIQQNALSIFKHDWNNLKQVKLHLKGTEFQLKVWEALLKIPVGKLSAYGTVAKTLGQPTASRAVGSAVGDNPVAYLIPCHRVIQSSGAFGQYHWGSLRKTAMIGWEAAQLSRVEAY